MRSGRGKQLFASSCAGCHGLDGRGGERAPDLTVREVQRMSDGQISRIVLNGVSGTGMPAFHHLRGSELQALVAHIRALQGSSAAPVRLPGSPVQGRFLFFGKAKCSACHMVHGEGGFIAGDLTNYGCNHSADEIRRALEVPDASPQSGAKVVTLITRDGRKYSGVVRNEDNFSVQLQSLDGTFHLFMRSDLQSLDYGRAPLMPTNYSSTLTRPELNDIASYLISAASERRAGDGSPAQSQCSR